ncbi:MAG: hypothetical protein JW806_01255 [Sedimentisphaerales bacterium]|nr:hypothetical protein [Sedimentisphaerales bacterium]
MLIKLFIQNQEGDFEFFENLQRILLKNLLSKKILLILFLFTAPAVADESKFVTYETDKCTFNLCNIELAKPAEKAIVFGISLIMDTYHNTFGLEFPDDYKVKVTIISGKENFDEYQQKLRGKVAPCIGFYSRGYREAVVLHKENEEKIKELNRVIGVVFHESSHMMFDYHIHNPPLWIDEGLAEYFEGLSVIGKNKRIFLQKNRQSWCKWWAKNGFPIELEEFLNLDYHQFYQFDSKGKNSQGYTIGYSLVYFMMSSNATENIFKEILQDIKKSGRQGKVDSVKIINENYEGGLERFERHWKSYILRTKESRPLRALRKHMDDKISSALEDSNDPNRSED